MRVIHIKGHSHGGVYTLHKKGISTRRGNPHGGDIYIEGIFMRRACLHVWNMYIEEISTQRKHLGDENIYTGGTSGEAYMFLR